jgi:hypothetical protein
MLTLSVGIAAQAAPKNPDGSLKGDYVEARTASVFAGACHYNGELTTTGREAELAWHITDGAWKGVPLSGLNVVASVVSDDSLKFDAARRCVLYVDEKADARQLEALVGAITANYSKALGTLVEVKRAPITFARKEENFRVEVKGVTKLAVDAMPNHECCRQPNLVWYEPLVALSDRKVGFTRASGIQDTTLGPAWSKSNQNTAFYGTFSL